MSLVVLDRIAKSILGQLLFTDVTFGITQQDRIGLIGPNGSGKSTLLKLIAGVEKADQGDIFYNRELSIGYLPQTPNFADCVLVQDYMIKHASPALKKLIEYNALTAMPQNKIGLSTLHQLHKYLEEHHGWSKLSEMKGVLNLLNAPPPEAKVAKLSGGEKKRVALAATLLSEKKLLLLDEPTNHLDFQGLNFLEKYCADYQGALILITHDRYLLNRAVTKILEIDLKKVFQFSGKYEDYLAKKAERARLLEQQDQKRKAILKQELEWLKQGVKARATRQKARLQRLEDLKTSNQESLSKLSIKMPSQRLGKKVLTVQNLDIGFREQVLIKNLDFTIAAGERLGIIGANGVGKSTLLETIAQKRKPLQGEIEMGLTVKLSYLPQQSQLEISAQRSIEFIKETAEYFLDHSGKRITAAQMMELFLFDEKMQWAPLENLSGGERRRLLLLKTILQKPNLLLLDEPTNDLDLTTLGVFESFLDDFTGSMLIVSHDRFFLDRICDRLLILNQDNSFQIYNGSVSNYFKSLKEEKPAKKKKLVKNKGQKTTNSKGLTYKEQRELEQLEKTMIAAEAEIEALKAKLIHLGGDYQKARLITEQLEKTEAMRDQQLQRWVELSELLEQES